MNSKRGTSLYHTVSSQAIISNQILHCLQDIKKQAKEEFSPHVAKALDEVDTELHSILLDAQKTIAEHSHLPWSPELHQSYKIWKHWKIQLSSFKTKLIPGQHVKEILCK
jgi:hypothetical protein